MSSLVSEFLINPVLRQARRFSSGFATDAEHDNLAGSSSPASPLTSVEGDAPGAGKSEHADDICLPPPPLGTRTDDPTPEPDLERAELAASSTDNTINHSAELAHTTTMTEVAAAVHIPNSSTSSLPEDDGMGLLRQRILAIQARDLQQAEKARMMHLLLMEGYNRSQVEVAVRGAKLPSESKAMLEQALATGPLDSLKFWNHHGDGQGGNSLRISLTEDDLRPTYVPVKDGSECEADDVPSARRLGCEHYWRNVKMQCATCQKWYTCRLCHDAVEDHQLPRKQTKNMLCMLCGHAQKARDACIKCGVTAARYYCGVCKLWNDNPDKPAYHCNDCGICRTGQGLGRDFFHCNRCMACISIGISESHKCIERSTDCDCPICGDNMFNSVARVIFMECGHAIHHTCYKELLKSSYRCPLCNKSVVNMEIQFRNYDAAIAHQPMPDEYRDTRAIVSCNDCSAKSQTAYHWLGLRCSICHSYNTVALQLLHLPSNALAVSGSEAALAVGAGAGAMSASPGLDVLPSPSGMMTPPSATMGPAAAGRQVVDEARPLRVPQPLTPRDLPEGGPTLAHENSSASVGSSQQDVPSFSPEGTARSVSPLPVVMPSTPREPNEEFDEGEEGEEGDFWDGDVLGGILSSPGESDNDGGFQGPESDDDEPSESEEDSDEDIDEADDGKEDSLMLPGHR